MQKYNSKEQLTTTAKKGLANDIISGGKTPYPASAADGDNDEGDDTDAVASPGSFHSMHVEAHENGLSVRTEHKTKPKTKESYPATNSMNHVFNNPDDAIKHVTKHIRSAYKK